MWKKEKVLIVKVDISCSGINNVNDDFCMVVFGEVVNFCIVLFVVCFRECGN